MRTRAAKRTAQEEATEVTDNPVADLELEPAPQRGRKRSAVKDADATAELRLLPRGAASSAGELAGFEQVMQARFAAFEVAQEAKLQVALAEKNAQLASCAAELARLQAQQAVQGLPTACTDKPAVQARAQQASFFISRAAPVLRALKLAAESTPDGEFDAAIKDAQELMNALHLFGASAAAAAAWSEGGDFNKGMDIYMRVLLPNCVSSSQPHPWVKAGGRFDHYDEEQFRKAMSATGWKAAAQDKAQDKQLTQALHSLLGKSSQRPNQGFKHSSSFGGNYGGNYNSFKNGSSAGRGYQHNGGRSGQR